MKFAISDWQAVSPFHQTKEDWQKWIVRGQKVTDLLPIEIDLSFLPAIKRRRLSSVARLMFAAAWPLLAEDVNCPVVFVSHDGEINRSFQLWHSLLKSEELSPTSFALSVHNAVAGQWSLIRTDMSENVAICAQCNGLELGVMEALGLLCDGADQVLVAVVDDPISIEFEVDVERAPFALALALVITKGDAVSLTFMPSQPETRNSQNKKAICYYSSTIEWIVQQIMSQPVRNQDDIQGVWQWQIN